jgi:hypothetical protein
VSHPNDAATAALLEGHALLPAALRLAEQRHARGGRLTPGISAVGRCRRRAAYGIGGTAPDPQHERRAGAAAWIGTWTHAGLLPLLARLLAPARTEVPVQWRQLGLPDLAGSCDLYRARSGLVLDVKTVSAYQLDQARARGVRPLDERQVTGYGQALASMGRRVRQLAVLYVCTETGRNGDDQGHLWLGAPDEGVCAANTQWWAEVTDHTLNPDDAPRDERGPGLSYACDECPWLRRCWGPDAVPGGTGAQATVAEREGAYVTAVEAYASAARAEADAKADKAFARACLENAPPGRYGAFTLAWGHSGARPDAAAMAAALRALGLPVPTVPTAARITVRPAGPG